MSQRKFYRFSTALRQYIDGDTRGNDALARSSGVPATKIEAWLLGTVDLARDWQDVYRLARRGLHLNTSDTAHLLAQLKQYHQFAHKLQQYSGRQAVTVGVLAQRSGISADVIPRWLQGEIDLEQEWQAIYRVGQDGLQLKPKALSDLLEALTVRHHFAELLCQHLVSKRKSVPALAALANIAPEKVVAWLQGAADWEDAEAVKRFAQVGLQLKTKAIDELLAALVGSAFNVLLRYHVKREGIATPALAERANISRETLRSWLSGRVKRPRSWADIVKVAAVLRLTLPELAELLQATNHATFMQLWARADGDLKRIFGRWEPQSTPQSTTPPPFQPPPSLPYFVGRQHYLSELERHLLTQRAGCVVIQGMGGAGKTELAKQFAYRFRHHFTDGVLWARVDASNPLAILSTFATAFGQDVADYGDIHSRSQVVRNLLASKRVLIILDNVEHSHQIDPLMPASAGASAVIVTTRHQNLSSLRGLPRLNLGSFNVEQEESLQLFQHLLTDADRFARAQVDLSIIATEVGHLPLAIAILGGRLAYEPLTSASALRQQLQVYLTKLDTMMDEAQSVRATFALTFERLSAPQQRFFSALGVFVARDFSVEAAATSADVEHTVARQHLTELHRLSLVTSENHRFTLHPLLATYAREQIVDEAVWERSADYFAGYVAAHQHDFDALDAEMANILATLTSLFEHDLPTKLIASILAFYPFLTMRGLDVAGQVHLERALLAAETLHDLPAMIKLLCHLGNIAERQGAFAHAEMAFYRKALTIAYQIEDTNLIVTILVNLASAIQKQQEFERAEALLNQSLALAQEQQQYALICRLHTLLGVRANNHRGNYDEAQAHFEAGLSLAQAQDFGPRSCMFQLNLGMIAFRRGNYPLTTVYTQACTTLAHSLNYVAVLAILQRFHARLAVVCAGDYARAEACQREGLRLIRGVEQRMTGHAAAELGAVLIQRNQPDEAQKLLDEALLIADKTQDNQIKLKALTAYGELSASANRLGEERTISVRSHFQEAYQLAQGEGDPWHRCHVLRSWSQFEQRHDRTTASRLFDELWEIAAAMGFVEMEAVAFYGLAQIALQKQDAHEAQRLGNASLQHLQRLGHHLAVPVRQWLKKIEA